MITVWFLQACDQYVWSHDELSGRNWCRGNTTLLQLSRDSHAMVLAPRRRDDLNAYRQIFAIGAHGHADHRQAYERNWLGIDAKIGSHRNFAPVDHHGLLTDHWCAAGRRRSQQRRQRRCRRWLAIGNPNRGRCGSRPRQRDPRRNVGRRIGHSRRQ